MRLTLRRPDDWHVHLRDGAALSAVVGATAAVFGRAVVMPNLKPPVRTTAEALAYKARILEALPPGSRFEPLVTLYLTDKTEPAEIDRAADAGIAAVKLYPAGATTNADAGVTDALALGRVYERLAERGLPLLIHGEVTDPSVDVFDREAVFVDRLLGPIVKAHPGLKVVLEHLTTEEGVSFVESGGPTVGATLTAHHLQLDRNAMFSGGLRPHHYCLPVPKRARHREALVKAATSGNPKFFLGTDTAPHGRRAKEAACGCAGLYTAPVALPAYAEVFEDQGALDRLEGFASLFGPRFYGREPNSDTVTLVKEPWRPEAELPFGEDVVVPWKGGEWVRWRVEGGA